MRTLFVFLSGTIDAILTTDRSILKMYYFDKSKKYVENILWFIIDRTGIRTWGPLEHTTAGRRHFELQKVLLQKYNYLWYTVM